MLNIAPRIVIIGNAPPQVDISGFVNTSDLVIRFNACPHYGAGLTGNRTDILCLAGGLQPTMQFIQHGLRPDIVKNIHKVLFKREDLGILNRLITERCNLEGKEVETISIAFLKDLLTELAPPSDAGAPYKHMSVYNDPFFVPETGLQIVPSFGMTAIAHFVKSSEYEKYETWVACFTWEGVAGLHPWVQEKALCESYANSGKLHILPVGWTPPSVYT